MTYSNGRMIHYNYDAGLDSDISRLSSITDADGSTLVAYTYLGDGTIVTMTEPGAGIELTYKQGGAGDVYSGLDNFGRVVDQKWISTSTGAAIDEFTYTYDRDGNVLTKDNAVLDAGGKV